LNFDWIVEGRVAAMAMPWPEDLPDLRRAGITAILSLTERVPREIAESAFTHLALPIRDFHAPTPGQIDAAVAFLDTTVDAGGACAVHCGAGLGRTGTIVAAWLVHHGKSAADAIAEVRRRRPGSVETSEQEAAVVAYARGARKSAGG
jgi:atypical dual specificity phosphatase